VDEELDELSRENRGLKEARMSDVGVMELVKAMGVIVEARRCMLRGNRWYRKAERMLRMVGRQNRLKAEALRAEAKVARENEDKEEEL
jgi:hypothetical protein